MLIFFTIFLFVLTSLTLVATVTFIHFGQFDGWSSKFALILALMYISDLILIVVVATLDSGVS